VLYSSKDLLDLQGSIGSILRPHCTFSKSSHCIVKLLNKSG